MTLTEILAKSDKPLRKHILKISPKYSILFYSYLRKPFLKMLAEEHIDEKQIIHNGYTKTLWDLDFNLPVFNAAGMFKTGEGYEMVARQGAGAFLAGTTTESGRRGNKKNGVLHPFIPLPRSGVAINWMGLPNPGHSKVARRLSGIQKQHGCPIGASIAADPDASENSMIEGLISGFDQYEKARVDFIELNESCPNVESHKDSSDFDMDLIDRLEKISTSFLKKRQRNLPVIVKFSVDMDRKVIPKILDILIELDFDGVNIGNTSTFYGDIIENIDKDEKKVFEYFTETFGGGVSGNALKERSLGLAAEAAEYIGKKELKREFHVIRTGGVESFSDVNIATSKGISLCQWFTGYFEEFTKHGHRLYSEMFRNDEE